MKIYFTLIALLGFSNFSFTQNAILVKDIHLGGIENGEKPERLFSFNNKLYFSANDGIHGIELWVSDGSEEGTFMLKDLYPGPENGHVIGFTEFNNFLYFIANSVNGWKIWRTNGTPEGTEIFINDLTPYWGGQGKIMEVVNDLLFFAANDGINGTELWASDGTVNGTFLVKNIEDGSSGSAPHNFVNFNDKLVFNVSNLNGQTNIEPWISDGTEEGTNLIKNIGGFSISSNPNSYTQLGDELFFTARHQQYGIEIWKTDGTEEGTMLIKDIFTLGNNSTFGPKDLKVFNNLLYFNMTDDIINKELWATNGIESETVMVKNIYPAYESDPLYLTEYNNQLFFIASDGIHGRELWHSDGTEEGTQLFYDLNNELYSGAFKNLKVYNGWLYFIGSNDNNSSSQNWWKTDGTFETLSPILPLFADLGYPFPTNLEVVESNGKLFFVACYDTSIGYELYKIEDENLSLIYNKMDVNLYPNPINTILNIESSIEIETIEIYSILGQKVYQEKIKEQNIKIELSFLLKGSYILSIQGKNSKSNHKIIKN